MLQPCVHCGQIHVTAECPTLGIPVTSTSRRPEDEALLGTVVADRYLVRELVGSGNTGTVLRVENVDFGREAAMKVLRPRFARRDAILPALEGEARTSWWVRHPCLCDVFDVGTLPDGAPYFVMEWIDGETLASRIGRERLSFAAAVDLMMQILAAIDRIHSRGRLLGDLRPQNVMLAERRGCRPLVKILDFGLSRLVALESVKEQWNAQRAAAAISGATASPTSLRPPGALDIPYYFSPERAIGEHALQPSSDLFVAAILFYQALTGEKPFVAPSWEGLLLQIAMGTPPPLTELRPDVPSEVAAVVARALSADPRARYSSAAAMQDALQESIAGHASPSASQAPAFDKAGEHERQKTAQKTDRAPSGKGRDIDSERSIEVTFELPTNEDFDDETALSVRGGYPEAAGAGAVTPNAVREDEDTAPISLSPEARKRIERLSSPGETPRFGQRTSKA